MKPEEIEMSKMLLRSAGEGFFGLDIKGDHTFVNPSAAKMLGYEIEELIGRHSHSAWHHTRPDGTSYPGEECPIYATLRNGVIQQGEEYFWRKDGAGFPVEFTSIPILNGSEEIVSAIIIFRDITDRKKAEEKLHQTLEILRKSLAGTIHVIAQILECRDPYTAGHQKRVSDLARAIAQKLSLSCEMTDNIRMAAQIHDIGKIAIPAEILSKPGKLTPHELDMIKTHPMAGFAVLKDAELPEPIAQIVFQHHERLDGSGYPQGLKGDKILLEARILAVADVVEAMHSHRPYRPSLGIDAALTEIKKNKGILYDPAAVDACLAVFSRGFQFK